MQKTFSEIKLFQVKPEKLELFEAIADTISKEGDEYDAVWYANAD